jgi:hypothetical protein
MFRLPFVNLAGFSSRLAANDKPWLAQRATAPTETGHQNSCSGSLSKQPRIGGYDRTAKLQRQSAVEIEPERLAA